MFFTRLLSRSFTRQPRRRGLIALTVALFDRDLGGDAGRCPRCGR